MYSITYAHSDGRLTLISRLLSVSRLEIASLMRTASRSQFWSFVQTIIPAWSELNLCIRIKSGLFNVKTARLLLIAKSQTSSSGIFWLALPAS